MIIKLNRVFLASISLIAGSASASGYTVGFSGGTLTSSGGQFIGNFEVGKKLTDRLTIEGSIGRSKDKIYQVYRNGNIVDSQISFHTKAIDAVYSAYNGDKFKFNLRLGIGSLSAKIKLDTDSFPLPNIPTFNSGLQCAYVFNKEWTGKAEFRLFSLMGSTVDGSMGSLTLGVTYNLSPIALTRNHQTTTNSTT